MCCDIASFGNAATAEDLCVLPSWLSPLQAEQLADAGLTASHIAKMVLGVGLGKATTLVQ